MGAAGNVIFINAVIGRKEAGHKVAVFAGRGHNQAAFHHLAQQIHVRLDGQYFAFGCHLRNPVARLDLGAVALDLALKVQRFQNLIGKFG